ncbi:hypothetical protein MMC28_000188 [Mycoblastus sanguinarius]|nr:hypothetical protein [Mycoblastus sanguinarius]
MFASSKRAREEEEDDLQELAYEHKRTRSLPFRTSSAFKHTRGFSQSSRNRPSPIFTQTITPADSSEEEASPPFASSYEPLLQPSSQLSMNSTLHIPECLDLDMDMTESQPPPSPCSWVPRAPIPSPNASPCSLLPIQGSSKAMPSKTSQDSSPFGRLPTPIYGHFQQSVDAKMDVDGGSEIAVARSQKEIDYENYVRRRRLPSPISEDEDMEFSTATAGGMMGRLAMSPANPYEHEKSAESTRSPAPKRPAPPQWGRMSFSMGVRANCEMCRMRVPGHSVHILRS